MVDQGISVRVYGRVQGVGFRYYVLSRAQELGIRGWIKNEHDGSVSLEAEGASLNVFLDYLRQGPPRARVDKFETHSIPLQGYTGFSIR